MGTPKDTIRVECLKFDPDSDKEPYMKEYQVPGGETKSVLNVLEYIYENVDPSLAFYASCRRGVCGRCMVKVNGKPRLACCEKVAGDVTLEPVKADNVVRDLKVEDR